MSPPRHQFSPLACLPASQQRALLAAASGGARIERGLDEASSVLRYHGRRSMLSTLVTTAFRNVPEDDPSSVLTVV
jgi:hypothetical protein